VNIFYLDESPKLAATYQCDRHVVKMIVETAQLLFTAHHELCPADLPSGVYKPTHVNHPCAKWVRSSAANYEWTKEHLTALLDEYEHRYERVHKVRYAGLESILERVPTGIQIVDITRPPRCMPPEFKVDSVVDSYRNYYVGTKSRFAKWKMGNTPKWYIEMLNS